MSRAVPRNLGAGMVAIGVLLSIACIAQQPKPAKPLQFEVAAIKPADKDHIGYGTEIRGGTYHITNAPLKYWVENALSVQDFQLKAPAWLETTEFSLDARGPSQTIDPKTIPEMMKSLLIERFGLKWHEETQPVSGYQLVGGNKVRMKPATLLERPFAPGWGTGPTMINGKNLPMSKLAELLGQALGRPVIDATHLSGGYDIDLKWRPDNQADLTRQRQYGKQFGVDVDSLPDVFTAVREQLGLRLESAKVPGRVVVIDQMNHQPTAN
jgi:uncharacterized protein (TIGR03435 family)